VAGTKDKTEPRIGAPMDVFLETHMCCGPGILPKAFLDATVEEQLSSSHVAKRGRHTHAEPINMRDLEIHHKDS